jgi:hypothetical protein
MSRLLSRIPTWADWIVAAVAAVILLNVNVTAAGDPLSGAGSSNGISDTARATFYGALMLGGMTVSAVGLVISSLGSTRTASGPLLARTFAFVAFAGTAGLLLDQRDGPVRLVQLIAYAAVTLGALRLMRATAASDDEATPA